MPLIQVKLTQNIFTEERKRQMIERLSRLLGVTALVLAVFVVFEPHLAPASCRSVPRTWET